MVCYSRAAHSTGHTKTFADPTFFEGHSATINVKLAGKKQVIGVFGILHPTVLKNFELP